MEQTGDMYFAAAILSYGGTLVEVDKSDRRRQKFIFSNEISEAFILDSGIPVRLETPTFKELEMCFIAKRLMFPPTYTDCLRSIKSSIHSE